MSQIFHLSIATCMFFPLVLPVICVLCRTSSAQPWNSWYLRGAETDGTLLWIVMFLPSWTLHGTEGSMKLWFLQVLAPNVLQSKASNVRRELFQISTIYWIFTIYGYLLFLRRTEHVPSTAATSPRSVNCSYRASTMYREMPVPLQSSPFPLSIMR